MTDSDTQAVVTETDAQATPAVEATSAQETTPSLDALLQEFETTAKPPAPAPKAAPAADQSEVAELRREFAALRFEKEIEPILKGVRGEVDSDRFSDQELMDWLDGRAKRDPALKNAYVARHENPRKWAKIQEALKADFNKKFQPRVDAAATEDKEAVAAAVRGTSTKAPADKAPNYGAMNNAQFEAEKAKLGI